MGFIFYPLQKVSFSKLTYLDQNDKDIYSACLPLTLTLLLAIYGSSIALSHRVWFFSLELDSSDLRSSKGLPPLTSSFPPRWVDSPKYSLDPTYTSLVGRHEKRYVSSIKLVGRPVDMLKVQLFPIFRKVPHRFFQISSLPWWGIISNIPFLPVEILKAFSLNPLNSCFGPELPLVFLK